MIGKGDEPYCDPDGETDPSLWGYQEGLKSPARQCWVNNPDWNPRNARGQRIHGGMAQDGLRGLRFSVSPFHHRGYRPQRRAQYGRHDGQRQRCSCAERGWNETSTELVHRSTDVMGPMPNCSPSAEERREIPLRRDV